MLNCQEATRLLSESQDHTLALKRAINLKLHTLMCQGCRNYDEHLKSLRKIARGYAKGEGAVSTLTRSSEDDSNLTKP